MRRASFIALAAIIVLANIFALAHALRNRVGSPDAEVTLTQRELVYFNRLADDDSGMTLHLQWTDPDPRNLPWPSQAENPNTWLNQQALQRLGFNCSLSPASPGASRFYQRQRPREAFVALEYDRLGWQTWLEAWQHAVAEQKAKTQFNAFNDDGSHRSHLVPIDADLDSRKLRARHPDRTAIIIVPALIAVTLQSFPKRPAQVAGRIQQLPSSIHVPRPSSEEFRRLSRNQTRTYRVQLRYGALLEPWVIGVEFQK
jgi:hypothetical protein